MNTQSWLALAGAGACAAVASILLKSASSLGLPTLSPRVMVLDVAAIAVYGIGFLLYAYSLRFFHVGPAYVCMVAVASVLLFLYSALSGEHLYPREVLGALVILVGVSLVAWGRAT